LSRRSAGYNTKQGGAVLARLAAYGHEYVTVAQIDAYFQNGGETVSRATIYRQLEKLVRKGKARKYTFDGTQGACFRYVEQPESGRDFYRLKCEACGGIFNLSCREADHVSGHMLETHAFQMNDSKLVFYGKCNACLQK
jgi:Fur family ferric uptake transcriptional regulator